MRQSSWLWDGILYAFFFGALIGLQCCAAPPRLEAPPDSGVALDTCKAEGEACDLPGVCCRGLLCVGEGVCAPLGELVWAPPDAGPRCKVIALLDISGSMSFDAQDRVANSALHLWGYPVEIRPFGSIGIVEPTLLEAQIACSDADWVLIFTDERPQGGDRGRTQVACSGRNVRVYTESGKLRVWQAQPWVDRVEPLYHGSYDYLSSFSEVECH